MQQLLISDDWDVVLSELQTMYPGKAVVYGWYYHYRDQGSRRAASETRRLIRERVNELHHSGYIICFHVKVQPPVYDLSRTALVARGVDPIIKRRLETALRRYQFPTVEK